MISSPEEAMKLTSGGNEMAVSPVGESSKPNPSRATSQVPKPVPARQTPETPRPVPARPTTEAPRPVLANSTAGSRKEIVCGLEALSVTTPLVRWRTNPSLRQPKTDEPPSPRALQIRSRVKQQAANATQVVQEPIVEVGDGAKDHGFKEIREVGDKAKDHGFKEIRQSGPAEELSELFEYLPAKDPTWKGRIVDSATPLNLSLTATFGLHRHHLSARRHTDFHRRCLLRLFVEERGKSHIYPTVEVYEEEWKEFVVGYRPFVIREDASSALPYNHSKD